jgi:hypothetical protein
MMEEVQASETLRHFGKEMIKKLNLGVPSLKKKAVQLRSSG